MFFFDVLQFITFMPANNQPYMKTKLFFTVLILSFFALGCENQLDEEFYQERTSSPPVLTRMPSHRGVYVNNFSAILGDVAKEDSLLNWCQANLFGRINLYNINTLVGSSTTATQLSTFIGRAKASPYFLKVSFVASSATAVNNFYTYYLTYPNKPDAITTEYEFWNSPNSFSTFMGIGSNMNTVYSSTTTPQVQREMYVSQFNDNAGVYTTTQIAQYIVNNCDRVFLVNYVTNAYNFSGSLQTKLQTLADAGAALNKVVKVVILFNVNTASSDPNIYNYFSTTGLNNPFQNAFNNVLTGYNSSSITNKTYLQLVGYQIYRYSDARLARP
jgi:hypothetical protein